VDRRMRFKKYRGKRRKRAIRRSTVKIQGVIETFLRQEGWTDKLHERQIFEIWESIVGTLVASQSVPVSLSNGILKVEIVHSSCWTELSAMKTQLLSKLEKKLDGLNSGIRRPSKKVKITDIRFRLNPNISKLKSIKNTVKSDSEVSEKILKSVSPEMKVQIEAAVSAVNDSELQAALKTLFLTQCSYTETAE